MTEMIPVLRPGPDWFTGGYAEAAFTHHLHRLAGKSRLRFLQVGAYCGDASVWLLEHILTHPAARLTDVDTWAGSEEQEHYGLNFDEVFQFYSNRILGTHKVQVFAGASDEFFASWRGGVFDFIYVDGSHKADQVLRDAVNAFRWCKPGGMIAFDDYEWGKHLRLPERPAPAIDGFLRCYEDRIRVEEVGLQVWVTKV